MRNPTPGTRYPMATNPGHPLAHASGRVRIHRAALWEKIGPGSHPCHWCGLTVDWFVKPLIQADHVDGDTRNNDPANLVPSCAACNGTRHNWQATECKKGHPFTPENTYVLPVNDRRSRPHRACRECTLEKNRKARRRRRERRDLDR